MTLPTLFARTSLGQVQQWQITWEGDSFFTSEGIVGGVITVSKPTICAGKNIGKTNETTPEQQAYKEAKAKWKKKLDSGYHEDVSKIDEAKFFEPTLAHKWKEHKTKVVYPLYAQPKYDGMRCPIPKEGMFSRNGKPVVSCPHVYEALREFFAKHPTYVFDGELYNHDLKHDFNKIMSLVKKTKPSKKDLEESAELVQFWSYDVCITDKPHLVFIDRLKYLSDAFNDIGNPKVLKIVPTVKVNSESEYDALYTAWLADGYEGGMTRDPNAVYEHDRTTALLKRKEFTDAEFPIIDIEDGKGNRAGIASNVIFMHPCGEEFGAGVIGNEDYARELFRNRKKYIGKLGTVRYQNATPKGVPRFGKMKIIRDYE
jgi:DNA ligase 1